MSKGYCHACGRPHDEKKFDWTVALAILLWGVLGAGIWDLLTRGAHWVVCV